MGTGASSGLGGDTTCGLRDVERETECEQARPPELAAETNKKSQYVYISGIFRPAHTSELMLKIIDLI